MADLIADFGARGDASTDDTAALLRAIASGQPIVIPEAVYRLTQPIKLPAGTELLGRGRPELLFTAGSGGLLDTAGDGVLLADLTLRVASSVPFASWALGLNHRHARVRHVDVVDAKQRGVLIAGHRNELLGGRITGSAGPGIQLLGGTRNRVVGTDLTGGRGFGIHLDQGAAYNELNGVSCEASGLELIGLTYSCYGNRILGCHAEGCGDNGISITGYENTVQGNTTLRTAHGGIRIYGSRNTVVGNVIRDAGQDFLVDGENWAGLELGASWGGLARDNIIGDNIVLDRQAAPTLAWGLRVSRGYYPAWAPATLLNAYPYRRVDGRIYKALGKGTTGAIAPTHTGGVASDGAIDWLFVDDGGASLDPQGNVYNVATQVFRGARLGNVATTVPGLVL